MFAITLFHVDFCVVNSCGAVKYQGTLALLSYLNQTQSFYNTT